MEAKQFKKLWNEIKNKKVHVAYGKQIFRNLVLVDYNEATGTVNTEFKGALSTRSIKSVELVPEHKPEIHPDMVDFLMLDIERGQAEVIEPEVEVVLVTPKLPENWKEKGYFIITGTFGGNWKYLELRDSKDKLLHLWPSSMKHSELLNFAYERKNKGEAPDFLVDDTYAAPQYFDISSSLIRQIK